MSLLGKVIGATAGFVVAGPVGAVAGAAIGGSKPATVAGNAVAKGAGEVVGYTEHVIEGVGKVIESGGVAIIDAVSNTAQALLNVAEGVIAFRPLRPAELALGRQVFGNSVPLERVVLSTLTGANNRPFTIPGTMIMSAAAAIPGIGPLLAVAYLIQNLQSKYVIFIGGAGYNNALNMGRDREKKGQTLIHELTHVWQGHNQAFQWKYVLNSAWKQCTCGAKAAYAVTPGNQWRTYDAEPQAMLVEKWFVEDFGKAAYAVPAFHRAPGFNTKAFGDTSMLVPIQTESGMLQAYMDSNVRPGRPSDTTNFSSAPTAPLLGPKSTPLITMGRMTPLKL